MNQVRIDRHPARRGSRAPSVFALLTLLALGLSGVSAQAQDKPDPRALFTKARRLLQQAHETIAKGEWEAAIKLYQAAADTLKAPPKELQDEAAQLRPNAFYNIACCQARLGRKDAALEALEESIKEGFRDLAHMEQDKDLASLHESPGWSALLKTLKGSLSRPPAEEGLAEARVAAREALSQEALFPFKLSVTSIQDGKPIKLEALRGKVVIVDIWGTWCPPCREEIPHFKALVEQLSKRGFAMVGLNYERGADDEAKARLARDFIKKVGINYPCGLANDPIINQVPDFEGFPTTLFVDREGRVRRVLVGLQSFVTLKAHVLELLEPTAKAAKKDEGKAGKKAPAKPAEPAKPGKSEGADKPGKPKAPKELGPF